MIAWLRVTVVSVRVPANMEAPVAHAIEHRSAQPTETCCVRRSQRQHTRSNSRQVSPGLGWKMSEYEFLRLQLVEDVHEASTEVEGWTKCGPWSSMSGSNH
jgi:hypothetical protein